MSAIANTDGGVEAAKDTTVECPAGCGAVMDENQLPHHLREDCSVVIEYRRREGIGEYRRHRVGCPGKDTDTQLRLSQFEGGQ